MKHSTQIKNISTGEIKNLQNRFNLLKEYL